MEITAEEVGLAEYPVEDLLQTLKKEGVDELLISGMNNFKPHSPMYHQVMELLKNGFPVKAYNLAS